MKETVLSLVLPASSITALLARHGLGISGDGSPASLEMAVSSLRGDRPLWKRLFLNAYSYAHKHHDIQRPVEFVRPWLSGLGEPCAA